MELSKAKIQLYASLDKRKHRDNQGLFVAEGLKCVSETLPFFSLEALIATRNFDIARLSYPYLDIDRVFRVSSAQMEKMSSMSNAPDVLAVYKLPVREVPTPSELKGSLVLMLDGVQDPGNLGTIMRTADWFGIQNIIASRQTADIFNPKAVQATMGAIGRVHVAYADLLEYIAEYKKVVGGNVYGTLLDGQNIYSSPLSGSGLIIMGNEGQGITDEVKRLVDSPLYIPSWPVDRTTVESLNVGIATAITLAEFRRRM